MLGGICNTVGASYFTMPDSILISDGLKEYTSDFQIEWRQQLKTVVEEVLRCRFDETELLMVLKSL